MIKRINPNLWKPINVTSLYDVNLSPISKLIHIYLQGFPEDTELEIDKICKTLNISKSKYKIWWAELIEKGYIMQTENAYETLVVPYET